MKLGVLITDGGPHPPDKWAEVTADQIIQISESAEAGKLAEARAFRDKIVKALTPHHGKVQHHERGQLKAHGDKHFASELNPLPFIEEALAEIVAAAKGLSFEAHFAKPETLKYVGDVLASHFATAQHIERAWASDDTDAARAHRDTHGLPHPDAASVHARAFQATHHPGEAET